MHPTDRMRAEADMTRESDDQDAGAVRSRPAPASGVLRPDAVVGLSGSKRALLEARLRRAAGPVASGTVGATPATVELSFAQERVWLLDRLAPGRSAYNAPRALRLRGPLDIAALRSALDEIVRRHEVLRTLVAEVDGAPRPRVLPDARVPFRIVDLAPGHALNGNAATDPRVATLVEEEVRAPFDLASDTLLRALLVRCGTDDHVLVLVSHHIASDDQSKRIVAKEFEALYRDFRGGIASSLAPPAIQYRDYAAWERRRVDSGKADGDAAYWLAHLAGAPMAVELPTDRPRPTTGSHRGATLRSTLGPVSTNRLRDVVRSRRATLFMGLHTGFLALLHRLTSSDDLLVGTPVSGRSRPEFDDVIGFFSNTLVLRCGVPGGAGFGALLDDVRTVCVEAFSHQLLPFERLVEMARPERDPSRHPIFQVMFTLRPGGVSVPDLTGLDVSPVQFRSGGTKFDLSLIAIDLGDHIQFNWEYSTDLFDEPTVARMAAQLGRLMDQALADVDRPLDELDLLDEDERRHLLVELNDTAGEFVPSTLVARFAEQAARAPGAIAVRSGARALTYGELDDRSGLLAAHLAAVGVGPGDRVGVFCDRSVDLMVTLVGVMRAGAAYVPVDPGYPADRVAFMLSDARVAAVLCEAALEAALPGVDAPVVRVDADWDQVAAAATPGPGDVATDDVDNVTYT